MCFICCDCNKSISGKVRGSIQLPYCNSCFSKFKNNDEYLVVLNKHLSEGD